MKPGKDGGGPVLGLALGGEVSPFKGLLKGIRGNSPCGRGKGKGSLGAGLPSLENKS